MIDKIVGANQFLLKDGRFTSKPRAFYNKDSAFAKAKHKLETSAGALQYSRSQREAIKRFYDHHDTYYKSSYLPFFNGLTGRLDGVWRNPAQLAQHRSEGLEVMAKIRNQMAKWEHSLQKYETGLELQEKQLDVNLRSADLRFDEAKARAKYNKASFGVDFSLQQERITRSILNVEIRRINNRNTVESSVLRDENQKVQIDKQTALSLQEVKNARANHFILSKRENSLSRLVANDYRVQKGLINKNRELIKKSRGLLKQEEGVLEAKRVVYNGYREASRLSFQDAVLMNDKVKSNNLFNEASFDKANTSSTFNELAVNLASSLSNISKYYQQQDQIHTDNKMLNLQLINKELQLTDADLGIQKSLLGLKQREIEADRADLTLDAQSQRLAREKQQFAIESAYRRSMSLQRVKNAQARADIIGNFGNMLKNTIDNLGENMIHNTDAIDQILRQIQQSFLGERDLYADLYKLRTEYEDKKLSLADRQKGLSMENAKNNFAQWANANAPAPIGEPVPQVGFSRVGPTIYNAPAGSRPKTLGEQAQTILSKLRGST